MKKISCQKGAAAIEMALITPLLLILLFGIIEFSLILYDKAIITNASKGPDRALYTVPTRREHMIRIPFRK